MSEIVGTKQLHFYFTGESFTNLVRDFWNSNLVKLAIGASTDSGIPGNVALKICTGEYKCVGDTREGDHTLVIEDDENPEGIYFTLESQTEHLENKFIAVSQTLTQKIRKHEMSLGGGDYRHGYANDELMYIENLREDRKKILENLEILYKITGKNITDLHKQLKMKLVIK